MVNTVSMQLVRVTVVGLLLIGCTRTQVIDRSMDFNEALEVSTNQMLLLNAVRASRKYPMHFSNISQVTATPKISTKLGFTLPFGGDASGFSSSPEFDYSHADTIVFTALNDQDFYRGILSPVGFPIVDQYLSQGWPSELLIYMFVERLELSENSTVALLSLALATCSGNMNSQACGVLVNAITESTGSRDDAATATRSSLTTVLSRPGKVEDFFPHADRIQEKYRKKRSRNRLSNDPADARSFFAFQAIAASLWVLDVDAYITVREGINTKLTKKTVTQGPNGKTVQEELKPAETRKLVLVIPLEEQLIKDGSSLGFRTRMTSLCNNIAGPRPNDEAFQLLPAVCEVEFIEIGDLPSGKESGEIRTWLRSPQGMIYYLGEIIGARSNRSVRDATKWLFRVETGEIESSVVSVNHQGEIFSIPSSGRTGHKSMQVLALINQILNLKKKATRLPFVPTVITTGD